MNWKQSFKVASSRPAAVAKRVSLPLRRVLQSAVLLLPACSAMAFAQNQITVNLSSSTGAITHGAAGWLYGQAEVNIPSQNLMAPLKPQISGQKPPSGLQHPGGDALQVAPSYVSSGGQQIEIYLQDIYQTFYPNPGISSYTATVQSIVRQLEASPNHAAFAYVPFNEPDGVVYGKYGTGITNLPGLESDWKTIYQAIKAINPNAVIVGPNFYIYDHNAYNNFMSYTKANSVLPSQVTWHELNSDFFSGWNGRYSDYRAIESSLGISPLRVVINEYGQSSGDIPIPGRMIQYISRFEKSKVYGMEAYWGTSGNLSSLGANGLANTPTGCWWLYKWYAGMSGNTVAVTPPNANAVGLQGVATLDSSKKQARMILGGTSGNVTVTIQGVSAQSYFGNTVHVTQWGVNNTGTAATTGPYYISEGNYTTSGGAITVTVANTNASSAYYLVVTPAKSLSNVSSTTRYEAEYADLFNGATVTYGTNTGYSGTYFVQGYGTGGGPVTEFDVTAPSNGFYTVNLRYTAPVTSSLQIYLNGATLTTTSLPFTANANTWSGKAVNMFLTAGINRIAYAALSNGTSNGVALDYIDVTPASGTITNYQASSSANTLGGAAVVQNGNNAPGGTAVGYIGQGSANYLQFNNVSVPTSGTYRMLVTFANNETYSGNSNSNPVFRFAQVSVNGGAAAQVYFTSTFSWTTWLTQEVDVQLNAGSNTIRFSNSTTSPSLNIESGYAPNISNIQIAAVTN